jgi:hypothetical protein
MPVIDIGNIIPSTSDPEEGNSETLNYLETRFRDFLWGTQQ